MPKKVNTMKVAIGSFLIDRLVSLGVSRLCGVPGDYNLEFLKLLAVYEIGWVLGSAGEISARLRRSASQPSSISTPPPRPKMRRLEHFP